MTAMPPLRDILNNTPGDAIDVDFNFNTIEAHIGSEVINRDGSVAMTGPLSLAGPPTAPQQAATKAYVDSNVIPIGTIWEFAGLAAPTGWAFCDGSSQSRTDPTYAALFAVIGTRHGSVDGTHFNLPDRRARVAIGYSPGDAVAGTLGAKGGNRDLIVPIHSHVQDQHQHGGNTNTADTNHYHAMRGHIHEMNHTHDSGVRHGYSMNIANQTGNTNAIWQPGGTVVSFLSRPSALCITQEDGANHQSTGSVQGRPDNNWTAGPNDNNTNWLGESGQGTTHLHPFATDYRTPGIQNAGVAPTNANYPLYEVTNFIVRIG